MEEKIELKSIEKPWWFACAIISAIAVFFLLLSLNFAVLLFEKSQHSVKTEAKIVSINTGYDEDGETAYSVYVDYEVDGVEYKNVRLGYYTAAMKEGKTITIRYDSRDPSKTIDTLGDTIGMILVGVIAIGLFIADVIVGKKNWKKKEKLEKQRKSGIVVRVPIVGIDKSGKHWAFECVYENNNYSSDWIHKNEDLYTGCTINIYFDNNEYYATNGGTIRKIFSYYFDLKSVEPGEFIEGSTFLGDRNDEED